MDLKLAGKRAIVTGASAGIGRATAILLVAEGVRVVAASRNPPTDLVRPGLTAVAVDLSTAGGVAELADRALSELGEVDILVNNVGGGDTPEAGSSDSPGSGFLKSTDEGWQNLIDLNLYAAVRMSRAVLPSLLRTRGSIVNVSSNSAKTPNTAPLGYGAAKGALNVFSKGLAAEFGPQGVRVNTVSPAATRTIMWEGENSFGTGLATAMGVSQQQLISAIPAQTGMLTGRFIEPDEVATVIAYLVSPLAASVLGADFVVDAGVSKTV